jgi:hypothetical protein
MNRKDLLTYVIIVLVVAFVWYSVESKADTTTNIKYSGQPVPSAMAPSMSDQLQTETGENGKEEAEGRKRY